MGAWKMLLGAVHVLIVFDNCNLFLNIQHLVMFALLMMFALDVCFASDVCYEKVPASTNLEIVRSGMTFKLAVNGQQRYCGIDS